MKSPREYQNEIRSHRKLGHQRVELAKSKAGVLEAGSPATGAAKDFGIRAVAGLFLLEQLKDKAFRRNGVLGNLHKRIGSVDAPNLLRMYQIDVDMILWLITCSGLVEIDEHAQRHAAVPEDMRDTFLRVLGAR